MYLSDRPKEAAMEAMRTSICPKEDVKCSDCEQKDACPYAYRKVPKDLQKIINY